MGLRQAQLLYQMLSMNVVLMVSLHIGIVYAQNSSTSAVDASTLISSAASLSTSSVNQNASSTNSKETITKSTPSSTETSLRTSTKGNSTPASFSQKKCKKVKAKNNYNEFWDRAKMKAKRAAFDAFFIVEIAFTVIGAIFTVVAIVITSKEGVAEMTIDREDTPTTVEERVTGNAFEED